MALRWQGEHCKGSSKHKNSGVWSSVALFSTNLIDFTTFHHLLAPFSHRFLTQTSRTQGDLVGELALKPRISCMARDRAFAMP